MDLAHQASLALSPRVCSNWCRIGQWSYLNISSSATLFSFCLQSFQGSGCFPMSRVLASGGQSTGTLTLTSVLPKNIQGWFPLYWLIWFLCHPRDSQESSLTPQLESINSSVQRFFMVQLSHAYMTTGKTIALTIQTFVIRKMSLVLICCLRLS